MRNYDYRGMALLETVDAKAGEVRIHTPKNLLNDVLSLIDGLRSEGIAIDINETKEI